MVNWEMRYAAGDTPWELGEVSPPLAGLLRLYRDALGHVLVPGCGRGEDALYAAELGADVTGWDLSATAIAAGRAAARTRGLGVAFAVRDALAPAPELAGTIDTVVEHTFFCALPLDVRPRYMAAAAQLLRPGGLLLGVFFIGDRHSGPPYGTTQDELRALAAPYFRVNQIKPAADSPGQWAGREVTVVLQRRVGSWVPPLSRRA